jgi:hypothetical protein
MLCLSLSLSRSLSFSLRTTCYVDDFPQVHWQILEGLVDILTPFKTATDLCQRDNATLYTFYNAFNEMKNNMNQKVHTYTHTHTHSLSLSHTHTHTCLHIYTCIHTYTVTYMFHFDSYRLLKIIS